VNEELSKKVYLFIVNERAVAVAKYTATNGDLQIKEGMKINDHSRCRWVMLALFS